MRRSIVLLLVGLAAGLVLSGSRQAAGQQLPYFFYVSGQDFLSMASMNTLYQLGYAVGVLDGMQEAAKAADFLLSDSQDPRTTVWRTSRVYRALACISSRFGRELTRGLARDIMVQYARSRTEDLTRPMAELATYALGAYCPQ